MSGQQKEGYWRALYIERFGGRYQLVNLLKAYEHFNQFTTFFFSLFPPLSSFQKEEKTYYTILYYTYSSNSFKNSPNYGTKESMHDIRKISFLHSLPINITLVWYCFDCVSWQNVNMFLEKEHCVNCLSVLRCFPMNALPNVRTWVISFLQTESGFVVYIFVFLFYYLLFYFILFYLGSFIVYSTCSAAYCVVYFDIGSYNERGGFFKVWCE